MGIKLTEYSGEPCGLGCFPDKVLMPFEVGECGGNYYGIGMMMDVALSLDKKTMFMTDCVDHCYSRTLTKKEALELADDFKSLADQME